MRPSGTSAIHGILAENREKRTIDIGVPVGIVAGLVPPPTPPPPRDL